MKTFSGKSMAIVGKAIGFIVFIVATYVLWMVMFLSWAYLTGFHSAPVAPEWLQGPISILLPLVIAVPPYLGYKLAKKVYKDIVSSNS